MRVRGGRRALLLGACAIAVLAGCSSEKARERKELPACAEDPGRVTIHRLNKTEYNNTVRDLLGDESRPADDFPNDDLGHGFDNQADSLTIAPLLAEKYDAAAASLAEAAVKPGSRILVCGEKTEACARDILATFAPKAWRGPVSDEEVDGLVAFVTAAIAKGDSFETGLSHAVHAALLSPRFLFRIENDAGPGPHPLRPWEVASRLSYFLWSTMPDDQLFAAAEDGSLGTPEGVRAQVRRMLADPKAQALVENFAGQWLSTRALEAAQPSTELFSDWDEALREAMAAETKLVFAEILAERRSLLELLDADFTYVNERLARHYGIEGVSGDEFRRVLLGADRAGVLTHGSFLTITSNPTRTSPVKRGKWVLSQLLCQEPPPPPPGVEGLPEGEGAEGLTIREQMELHRAAPACQSCHVLMDPIGFGLENYDPVGTFRTQDENGNEIDPAGELPDGSAFAGAVELTAVLKNDPMLSRCMATHTMVYALGRALGSGDECALDGVVEAFAAGGYSFDSLVEAIATSAPFTMRRPEVEE